MKRHFKVLPAIILAFICTFQSQAQADLRPLPIDPKVRYGKLDNGITYYIRHNELPKSRAEFFIAQQVGSVLEEDNQAGLAHFLEHMAFNGTKNLPDKTMINYLESIGVKFGENLNAYTGFDQTVYNISNVPVIRESIIDTCLLVLHDWSGFISLKEEEINKERGVIREEMRTRNHASYRQIEQLLPLIMPGSQYAKRMPIGTEQVVMGFKPEDLRAYYHKWYRPDLQGLIIIGDIDVDQIEAKIKQLFADIPKPVNPAERVYYPVPDNDTPLVGIVKDKEATGTNVQIFYKHDPMPAEQFASMAGLAMNYIKSVTSSMLNDRFNEIQQKANPPFIYAGGYDGDYVVAKTKDAWSIYGTAKEDGVEETLKSITREVERAKRFGFTASEYERAKTDILKNFENMYNEREKVKNNNYAREYVDHFVSGGYIPGIEFEYRNTEMVANNIPLEAINSYFSQIIGDKNIAIALTAPDKENIVTPTKEQLLTWFQEVKQENIQAYEDKVSNEPLMAVLPTGGKIKSETKEPTFGTVNYTLSNGVKVIIKSTQNKDDEILMSATSPGGSSLFPETQIPSIKLYSYLCNIGGLGNFSVVDLQKLLTGKKVSVSPTIGVRTEGFSGNASPKDFETMLQLIYLQFTAPRMDEEVYQSNMQRMKSQLESREVDPSIALVDTLYKYLYQDGKRISRLKPSELPGVDYQTIMNWRKERYKDASDFTFIFVGNIDPEATKSLIAQYLGSLPSIQRKEAPKDVNIGYNKGVIGNTFNKPMQDPKTTVIDIYSGTLPPTLENRIKMDMLQQILRIVYTEKVREDQGGTYGVGVNGGISSYPKGQASVQISFDTNAEKKDLLNEIIHREFNEMANNGPREEDFNKVLEFMLKKRSENEQENGFWLSSIQSFYETEKYNGYTEYLNILQKITKKDIQAFTKSLLTQNNKFEEIMVGVKQ